ncbi:MAG: SpoIIE family protein phosphatase [Candidatus Eisenbacteria bacterium]|nr:SpoIIE family protein phosphatase [Candidatus Eisenbacteria bacterium]
MTSEAGGRPNANALLEENKRLRRAVEELATLNDLSREIGASLDSGEIMNTIVRRSLRAVGAEQGVVHLVERKSDEDMLKTLVRTRLASSTSAHPAYALDKSLLGWMQIHKKPLLVNDPKTDDRFRGVRWDVSVQSLLAVPLLVKGELTGVLTVYNKKEPGGFTVDDQRLLAILAAQSAQVVENARLYEEEKALLRMRQEVRFATEIQERLLPKEAPRLAGYDIAGRSLPAMDVGGDYFDFIPIDTARLAFCLGDVTGKGLPAALLMANLQATIRGQALVDCAPSECMRRSNRLLFHSTDPVKFATLFYGVLDSAEHRLSYCCAGHDYPFFFRGEEGPLRLAKGGMMLGALEDSAYEGDTIPLAPGDLFVAYSDGITEAMDASGDEIGEEFGETRLLDFLRAHRNDSAEALIEALVAAVRAHAGVRPQSDDMTILVIRRIA